MSYWQSISHTNTISSNKPTSSKGGVLHKTLFISSRAMDRIALRLVFFTLFLVFLTARSESDQVKQALIRFMQNLSPGNAERGHSFGWNSTSDPCKDKWQGVTCDTRLVYVRKIVLDDHNLTGILDAGSLCVTPSLFVLSLNGNNIRGAIQEEISNCRYLNHLYLSGNHFSGNLPGSFSQLVNLNRLVLSNNDLSGQLPDMSNVSSLLSFLVENNQFSGEIPNLNFSKLQELNVSNNNFSGAIPDVSGRFGSSSFSGNPELCGKPLSKVCPVPAAAAAGGKMKTIRRFLGYAFGVLCLVLVFFVAFTLMKKKKSAIEKKKEVTENGVEVNKVNKNDNRYSGQYRAEGENQSEYSIAAIESAMGASSLVVLSSPVASGLKFEDLLRAPAELVGRGNHGSLFKVTLEGGVAVAVKRIKDWGISKEDFEKRMQRIHQVKHPNVLPALAYYCSDKERMLVYEFQENGSLFDLLHGSQNGERYFDWRSRVSVAAIIAEALAFIHESLQNDRFPHGNLKSSNILINKNMEPCISEYGLMAVGSNENQTIISQTNSFNSDIYSFGVILLELLTGKPAQNGGIDLVRWVQTMVEQETTVEVFDKALISEGASEERMMNLLQVALKCTSPFPDARPSIDQGTTMIRSVKEEEEVESLIISSEIRSNSSDLGV